MTAEGWTYDSGDRSVGLDPGGWLHEACPEGTPEPIDTTDTIIHRRHEGSGFDRTVVLTHRLTCSCGATATIEERDWAPEGPED